MADSLYLNLWFPSFTVAEMMPRMLCVLNRFPFSQSRPGIGYVGVHGVNWNEPVLFQETFDYRAEPQHAIALATEFLHDDGGYVFEALWDLWAPGEQHHSWTLKPSLVKFLAHGQKFADEIALEQGDIQVDFGPDSAFLLEDLELTQIGEQHVKENIQKLVEFTAALEKHCGVSGRLLSTDSEENLAQKLISRLQKVQ